MDIKYFKIIHYLLRVTFEEYFILLLSVYMKEY